MSEWLKYYEGPEDADVYHGTWHPKFTRYHRDNLISVFALIGYGAPDGRGLWPFTYLNTGDWVGEIPQMLAKPKPGTPYVSYTLDDKDRPNQTLDIIKDKVIQALARKMHKVQVGVRAQYGEQFKDRFECTEDGHLDLAQKIFEASEWE